MKSLLFFRIYQILAPVTLCCIYVILWIRILAQNSTLNQNVFSKTWLEFGLPEESSASSSLINTIATSLLTVAVFLGLIGLITLAILFVFWMGWHSYLIYYFYLPSIIVMLIITPAFFRDAILSLNCFSLDLITLVIILWNFFALGMISIFECYAPGPLILQQTYLIHNASMLSILITMVLPGWAPWILLFFLVLWDLFAVMAPFGPLNMIIKMAERQGIIDMPGLIYVTDDDKQLSQSATRTQRQPTTANNEQPNDTNPTTNPMDQQQQSPNAEQNPNERRESFDDNEESVGSMERGLNMGLGDFVFYGLLIAITCTDSKRSDFYMTLAVIDAVLVGVIVTLVFVSFTRKALPALPISISLGLLVASLSSHFVSPLLNKLASHQIFI